MKIIPVLPTSTIQSLYKDDCRPGPVSSHEDWGRAAMLSGFKSLHCYFPAVWPWKVASCSLALGARLCKTRMLLSSTSQGYCKYQINYTWGGADMVNHCAYSINGHGPPPLPSLPYFFFLPSFSLIDWRCFSPLIPFSPYSFGSYNTSLFLVSCNYPRKFNTCV